ncbi:unnamed protein product [Closterium sp. NIES-64]|nr:unnamed protein product [Closterium sp. NIES-64]
MSSLASHFALSAQSLPAIPSDCFRPRQGSSNGARCQSSQLAVTAAQTRPLAPSLPPQSTSRYSHSRRADIAAPPRVMAAYAESAADGTPRLPNSFHEITSEQELDWVLKDAADCGDLVLIDWMAQWCRKCIYLKPKIEKLVPEYPKSVTPTALSVPPFRFCPFRSAFAVPPFHSSCSLLSPNLPLN